MASHYYLCMRLFLGRPFFQKYHSDTHSSSRKGDPLGPAALFRHWKGWEWCLPCYNCKLKIYSCLLKNSTTWSEELFRGGSREKKCFWNLGEHPGGVHHVPHCCQSSAHTNEWSLYSLTGKAGTGLICHRCRFEYIWKWESTRQARSERGQRWEGWRCRRKPSCRDQEAAPWLSRDGGRARYANCSGRLRFVQWYLHLASRRLPSFRPQATEDGRIT